MQHLSPRSTPADAPPLIGASVRTPRWARRSSVRSAKVVARLGRRGRRGDDADDGQGGLRHTPLNAAWAILQAYAIIAIATSSYGSIFASPPPPPEQSAVRPPNPRARPARSTRALEPEPPFAPRRRPDEFAAVFFSPCQTDAPRSTRGAHRVPRPPPVPRRTDAQPDQRQERPLRRRRPRGHPQRRPISRSLHHFVPPLEAHVPQDARRRHGHRQGCAVRGLVRHRRRHRPRRPSRGGVRGGDDDSRGVGESQVQLARTPIDGVASCLRISWTVVGPPLRYALPFSTLSGTAWNPRCSGEGRRGGRRGRCDVHVQGVVQRGDGPHRRRVGQGADANRRARQRVWRLFDVRVAPGCVLLHVPRALRRPSARDTPHPSAFVAAMGRAVQEDAVGRVDRVLRSVRLRISPAGEPLREKSGDPMRGARDRRMRRGVRQRRRAGLPTSRARCKGKRVDCKGVCGGGAEVGCDGGCSYAAAQTDKSGKCCAFPSLSSPRRACATRRWTRTPRGSRRRSPPNVAFSRTRR